MQINAVGPVYQGREKSEPLLRDAIKVSTVVAFRGGKPMVG